MTSGINEANRYRIESRPLPPAPAPQGGELRSGEHMQVAAYHVRCSRCGKDVSSPVMHAIVVRAFVECPECISKTTLPAPAASPLPAAAVTGELPSLFNAAFQATKWKMMNALTQEECDLWTAAWEVANSVPAQPQAEASEELAALRQEREATLAFTKQLYDERDALLQALAGKAHRRNYSEERCDKCRRPYPKVVYEKLERRQPNLDAASELSALTSRSESAEAERDRLKEERDEAKARNVSYDQFVYRLSMKLQSAVRMSGNLEDFVDAACSRLADAESRAEQLAEALKAFGMVNAVPLPGDDNAVCFDHCRQYRADATHSDRCQAARAALATPAPTPDAKGA